MLRTINHRTNHLRFRILQFFQQALDELIWEELISSIDQDNDRFTLKDEDRPIIRDLKCILNMLGAVKRMTESYSLIAVTVFKRMEIPAELIEFNRHRKIYNYTNSPLSHYLARFQRYFQENVVPPIQDYSKRLIRLVNVENLQHVAEFTIENVITLEQYQQKYLQAKRLSQKNRLTEEKIEQNEGFFTLIAKTNDRSLRKYYQHEFDKLFLPPPENSAPSNKELKTAEVKDNKPNDNKKKDHEKPKEKSLDYYFENDKDDETLKNIKRLTNGIIAIKNLLDDYANFKKSGVLEKFWNGSNLAWNFRKAYICFQTFDYQAAFAEQTNPLAEYLKKQLKKLNERLEELCCFVDLLEYEKGIKQGYFFNSVNHLLLRYYQITYEVKIEIDYHAQKNGFFKSRLKTREAFLSDIETQIHDVNIFLRFKMYPLSAIPKYILTNMRQFITRRNDDIAMNRKNLRTYETYLDNILANKKSCNKLISQPFEYLGNRMGVTIHSEFMESLRKRKLYLARQHLDLTYKLNAFRATELNVTLKYYLDTQNEIQQSTVLPPALNRLLLAYMGIAEQEQSSPSQEFNAETTWNKEKLNRQLIVFVMFSFANHIDQLNAKKESLCLQATVTPSTSNHSAITGIELNKPKNEDNNPGIMSEKKDIMRENISKSSESKNNKPEEPKALTKDKRAFKYLSERKNNLIAATIKELGLFKIAEDKCKSAESIQTTLMDLHTEDCLSPESLIFIDDIKEVMQGNLLAKVAF